MATLQMIDRQVYTTGTPTWTKPSGAKMVEVLMIGGGGGGGGGHAGATFTGRCGGTGGCAGVGMRLTFDAASLSTTEAVAVGAGGAGGPAETNGTDGTASSFGSRARAIGGTGGFNGSLAADIGNGFPQLRGPYIDYEFGNSIQAGGSSAHTFQNSDGNCYNCFPWQGANGGGGGSIDSANSRCDSRPGPVHQSLFTFPGTFTNIHGDTYGRGQAGAAADGATPTAVASPLTISTIAYAMFPSYGGAGGGSSLASTGGAGGAAQGLGGGGGGGGAATTSNTAGAGGAGSNGIVVVTTYGVA